MKRALQIGGIVLTVGWLLGIVLISEKLADSLVTPPTEIHEVTAAGNLSGKEKDGRIVMFRINGVIRGSDEKDSSKVRTLCTELVKAGEDPNVKAVLLDINTPGGEVAASDSIRHALEEFKKSGKPVVAYFDALAASGGYYIGSGADWIVCHPQSFTGSIGVIIQAPNYEKLFEKTGLKMYTFKSGKLKDMLNGARSINPEETKYTQTLVDDTYETFLQLVARSRKLDPEKLRNGIADGRVLLGTEALKEGLVDQNGYIEDAISKARQAAGAAYKVEQIKINRNSGGLLSGLLGTGAADNREINLRIGDWTPEALTPGVPYMLYIHDTDSGR
jgi:protease IV